jgi:hypothetical protein
LLSNARNAQVYLLLDGGDVGGATHTQRGRAAETDDGGGDSTTTSSSTNTNKYDDEYTCIMKLWGIQVRTSVSGRSSGENKPQSSSPFVFI